MRGVVANSLYSEIADLELHLCHYVHFRIDILWRCMNLLILLI